MKYMGSKRSMLQNGLGDLIKSQSQHHERIVDLFCGASSVAWFSAQKCNKPVLAVDLQHYATTLASAVISRTSPIDISLVEQTWLSNTRNRLKRDANWIAASDLDDSKLNTGAWVKRARALCSKPLEVSPIWSSYGGYYFSPSQAIVFDTLIKELPSNEPLRSVCLASVIIAASKCAASPGHTAQPFGPTRTAGRFLREAWDREPIENVKAALKLLCPMHASLKGMSKVQDALIVSKTLKKSDLVFIDPPYSGVHYSRFYHVLETIARGQCGTVTGTGRYPPPSERPTSDFSRTGRSLLVFEKLLKQLSNVGSTVIITFPARRCSNGLSGNQIAEVASRWFKVTKKFVRTRFSTLGGNGKSRDARHRLIELILLLN